MVSQLVQCLEDQNMHKEVTCALVSINKDGGMVDPENECGITNAFAPIACFDKI